MLDRGHPNDGVSSIATVVLLQGGHADMVGIAVQFSVPVQGLNVIGLGEDSSGCQHRVRSWRLARLHRTDVVWHCQIGPFHWY